MIFLDAAVISWTARHAKSIAFSGCPNAKARAVADVAGVCGARRVAAAKGRDHGGVRDGAAERAIADRMELAVPAGRRHPDFDLDVGIGRRLQRRGDATERRQRASGLRVTWT